MQEKDFVCASNLPDEVWVSIKNYPNYMISNLGRVKVVDNVVYYSDGRVRHNKGHLKKVTLKNGYCIVRLFNEKGGKGRLERIHRLVAEAFIPNPEGKPFIDHINTIRTDNRIENLRWVTHKENSNNPITVEKNRENKRKWLSIPKNRERFLSTMREVRKNPDIIKRILDANRTKEIRLKRRINNGYGVLHFDEKGVFIERFYSTAHAAESIGSHQATVWSWCAGKRKPRNKHIWKYDNEGSTIGV